MPLFKKISIPVKGIKTGFSVNITGEGLFYCNPNATMAAALGIERFEGKSFSEVESAIYAGVYKYNLLNTEHKYFLLYRMHLSSAVKNGMPDTLMTPDMWQKTNGTGNQIFYGDDLGLIIEWFGLVESSLGETVVKKKCRLATEDDLEFVNQYGDLYINDLHKVYQGGIFFAHDEWYDFQGGEKFFKIPLTEETHTFFTGFQSSLINMLTKMLGFLSQEPVKLMEGIRNTPMALGLNSPINR